MTDFAITENDARIQYTATASQTVFPYDFPIFDQTHLAVTRVRSGTTTTLVLTTDYTVSGVGASGGGNVTLTSGATASDLITIARDVPAARATDYNAAGDFFATSLNQDLDLLVMVDQQIIRDQDRALRLSISDTLTTLNALPSASTRAGAFLTFDASGQPSVAAAAADAPVSSAMLPVLAAISTSAGRDAFGVEIGSDVQAYDAALASIAGISGTADQLLYLIATDSFAATTITQFGRTLIDDVSATVARTTMGLAIGADVQAFDAGLSSLAALAGSADLLVLATATDTFATTTITQFGRTLIDDASASVARTTLGIANHENIVISAAGEAINALQPAFLAYNSAADTNQTGNGANATVDFDTEIFDQNNDFASDTFTAPVTGRYLLTASVGCENFGVGASSAFLNIVTSNRSYRFVSAYLPVTNVNHAFTLSVIADMDAGDTAVVKIQINGMAGNTVTISGGSSPIDTFFSGMLST